MKRPLILLALAVALLAAGRRFAPARSQPASAAATTALSPTWPAPDFAYPDQDQRTVTRQQLLGHVWIADLIFTQCRSACPLLTARMVMLQRQLAQSDVRFVSFSVDPAHDTPAELKRYAQKWHGDESRWRLLATTPAALRATVAGLRLLVAASSDARDPIIHSDRFLLVDAAGIVRGAYASDDADDLAQLVADARRLAKPAADVALAPAPTSGRALYAALGCDGCHDRDDRTGVAPQLGGLFGSRVILTGTGTGAPPIVADERYLRDSIVAPAAQVVAGYGATMPSYAGLLNERQLAALVGYVKSLAADGAPSAARQRVVDPVCKMEIAAAESDPHVDRDGRRYYFCSDACRHQFTSRDR